MSDRCFVDTSILVYAHDRAAGVKHTRARQLVENVWNSGRGVLSTQVLQELCVSLRRKARHPLSVEEVRRLIEDYLSWEVVINTPPAIIQALELEARYKILFSSSRLRKVPGLPSCIPRTCRRDKVTVPFASLTRWCSLAELYWASGPVARAIGDAEGRGPRLHWI